MSILDRVREKFQMPMSSTCKTSESPSAAFAGTEDRHLKSCEPPSAGSAGTADKQSNYSASINPAPDDTDVPPFSAVQEAARLEMLAKLAAHPTVERAFATRWEAGALIVTLAIRGIGTGELLIPADRMGRDDLKAYGQLLECLSTSVGRS
jgi:hypothetical protein